MNFKSLVLGAAGIVAASGAFAADLPVAPEPVDYVRVCDAYGTGFFYIPGTETCLRVAGRVRVDLNIWDADGNRNSNYTTTLARGYVKLDARTNTEFGLLRSYVEFQMTESSSLTDKDGANGYNLEKAYIQLGGLTVGHTGSMFDFYTGDVYEIYDQSLSDRTLNLFAYTAAFGNGFSATLSVEDGSFRRSRVWDSVGTWVLANSAFDGYGGHWWPDLVANLRVDQGWGSAQVMGALHDVRDGIGAADDSEIGWAIGAGVTVNLPMLAPGDSVSFQAVYSEGATDYAAPSSEFASIPLGGVTVVPQMYDALRNPLNGNLELTEAWSIGGGFTHFWTPAVSSSFTATYLDVDQTMFGNLGGGVLGNRIGDFDEIDLQGNLVWRPVSGLAIGAEIDYYNVDRSVGADYDDWAAKLRFQTDF